jgi:hypothetical protein
MGRSACHRRRRRCLGPAIASLGASSTGKPHPGGGLPARLEEEVVDQVACLGPLDCLEEGLQVGLVDELSVLALAETLDDVTDLLDFFVRDTAVGNDRDLQKGDQREPLVPAKIRKLYGALAPARRRTSRRVCDTLFAGALERRDYAE